MNVAESIVDALSKQGVTQFWGVVGDALNPVTDALRRQDGVEWIGTRHEEAGAFAAAAQAQLTGKLGVCMGTVGPGSIHLLNGLYDAKKSHAPVLAICGQVPLSELGTNYFQEVDNDALFSDVSVFHHTLTSAEQMPKAIEMAVQASLVHRGVSVLTLPGDVGAFDVPEGSPKVRFVDSPSQVVPDPDAVAKAVELIDGASSVAMLVGIGARDARDDVLALAERLSAPMVLTLKAKDGFDRDNRFQVGQSGLLGNPASRVAMEGAELLLMIGTDFPYSDWYPKGKTVVQVDTKGAHIGRRTSVDHGVVGDAGLVASALVGGVQPKGDTAKLDKARKRYLDWRSDQDKLADPAYDKSVVGRVRSKLDNPDARIRPEAVAAAVHAHAAPDAIFTSDTGMSTVWLARFVEMVGERRLIGSYNLGSMANAMPQALGAQALDRDRQVIAFCGDGGLTMLLGDLITSVSHELPVKLVVFNNGRLGMVKLEQEQGGLPEFGTHLDNPDLAAVGRAIGMHGIRVEDPHELDGGVAEMFEHSGPVLLDAVTNPDEVSLPPKITAAQSWGFAVAKLTEEVESRRS